MMGGDQRNMPYPPKRPPKHRNREEARAASNAALVPHQFQPGSSGNVAGFPKGRRDQLELIERLAREASVEMVEVLQKLARESEDDRVKTMAASKLLEFWPKRKEYDPTDVDDRGYSRLRNMSGDQLREWLIGRCRDIATIRVPAGYVASEADLARHAVVRAALAMAINGIAAINDELVDVDALRAVHDARRHRNGGGAPG